ncbi:MAG: general secretion pathway protein H [Halieaceae bacterium]|jgi:general secretion pathway protein H
MRILATGETTRIVKVPRAAGFSLVEMLVVLFVIVLITGMVTLGMNSGAGDRALQDKVEALFSVAAYALDEAQFSGTDFGLLLALEINEAGEEMVVAHWQERLPRGWGYPQRSVEVFDSITFPPGVELYLRLDGQPVDLVNRAADRAANSAAESTTEDSGPQWLFTAGGETQSGEILWRDRVSGEVLWRLEWNALARFEVFRGDADAVYGESDARFAAP